MSVIIGAVVIAVVLTAAAMGLVWLITADHPDDPRNDPMFSPEEVAEADRRSKRVLIATAVILFVIAFTLSALAGFT